MLDLTASNPTICGFTYPQSRILEALSDPRALEYSPESKGLAESRAAVAAYYCGRPHFRGAAGAAQPAQQRAPQSAQLDPQHVLLTSGTSEAYSFIFRLICEPGDEILVPEPSYPLLQFLADLADVRLVPYPLLYDHGWFIDFRGLRAAATSRTRAIAVVHPNNPTGSYVRQAEAAELADICAGSGMAIIADEVFLDYWDGAAAETFAFNAAALTFTLSGISKICALPQMKLAWITVSGPAALVDVAVDRLEIIADTYLSPSVPVQLALPAFLELRGIMQEQIQHRVRTNLALLDDMLRRDASAISRLDREAGWYAILRVPVSGSDETLAVMLIERYSVLVHPGHFFNFPQEGFVVVSLITAEAEFQEGVRRLLEFFAAEHCV